MVSNGGMVPYIVGKEPLAGPIEQSEALKYE
jgi:hypothetical protein